MPPLASPDQAYWPLVVWIGGVAALMAVGIALSPFLGPRSNSRRRNLPYESGVPPTPQAEPRFPVHFYLVALAFLVFDLEVAFPSLEIVGATVGLEEIFIELAGGDS